VASPSRREILSSPHPEEFTKNFAFSLFPFRSSPSSPLYIHSLSTLLLYHILRSGLYGIGKTVSTLTFSISPVRSESGVRDGLQVEWTTQTSRRSITADHATSTIIVAEQLETRFRFDEVNELFAKERFDSSYVSASSARISFDSVSRLYPAVASQTADLRNRLFPSFLRNVTALRTRTSLIEQHDKTPKWGALAPPSERSTRGGSETSSNVANRLSHSRSEVKLEINDNCLGSNATKRRV